MSDTKVSKYPGTHADVSWHGGLCIHVGECTRAKGALFVGGRNPWCQPDLATIAQVEEVIARCPTGALSVELEDGTNPETPAAVNTISVAYNGPLFVRGQLDIDGAPADAPGVTYRAALCRCGQSANKPFCDNSHEKAGFRDSGAVGETGTADGPSGGTLSIKPAKDGPLLVNGKVKILSGSGRQAWQGAKVALCRCGASGNKPFCDGSHKKIGFRSE